MSNIEEPLVRAQIDNVKTGISFSLAFLSAAALLYFFPMWYGSGILARLLALILTAIGIAGLGFELDKLGGKDRKLGFGNLGAGVFVGIIWGVLSYYLNVWWARFPLLVLFLFASYGVFLGLIEVAYNLSLPNVSIRVFLAKLALAVVQIVALVAAVLQSLQILDYID